MQFFSFAGSTLAHCPATFMSCRTAPFYRTVKAQEHFKNFRSEFLGAQFKFLARELGTEINRVHLRMAQNRSDYR